MTDASWHIVSMARVAPTAWRNGGGQTRELLAWPTPRDWQVRISVADVASDGPFSTFPGVERWLAVIEGPGVELRHDGRAKLLAAGVPLRFDGGTALHCALPAGPTRGLNLMTAPGRGSLRPLVPGDRLRSTGRRLLALYAHIAPATLAWNGAELDLPAFSLAWRWSDTEAGGQLRSGSGWWMEVQG